MHWILLFLMALLWGPSFLAIKYGLRDIPPLSLAAGRVVIATLLLYGIMRMKGNRFPRTFEFWKKFTIMGFLANALPFSLLMIGETKAPSALAAIFNGFTPVATAIIAHVVIAEERLTAKTFFGVVLGFAGILLLFVPSLSEGFAGNDRLIGLICFGVMAISYGFSITYSRVALRGYPGFVGPTAQLLTAGVLLLPAALIFEWDQIVLPGIKSLGALIWLAVIATAIAYVVYYRMLEIAGATFLSLVTFMLPPIGAILGVLFLDEHLSWYAIVGCLLILGGVGFVRNVKGKEE
ncbi:MAG: DMT family transporter [Candidatus Kapaibacterium sp.]